MKINPCKDCQNRILGCHTTCLKYIDWKIENDLINKKRIEDRDIRRYEKAKSDKIKHYLKISKSK